jgi:hypothetical protein
MHVFDFGDTEALGGLDALLAIEDVEENNGREVGSFVTASEIQ